MDAAEQIKILKRDSLGRVTMVREQREALLDEFARSGLKGAAFARAVGINYQTFASWVQPRRHARGDYPNTRSLSRSGPVGSLLVPGPLVASEVRFVEAVLASPVGGPAASHPMPAVTSAALPSAFSETSPCPSAMPVTTAVPSAVPSAEALQVLLPGGACALVATARQATLAAQLINSLRTLC